MLSATPCRTASAATALAICSDTERISSRCGKSEAFGSFSAGETSRSASPAAINISSTTRLAPNRSNGKTHRRKNIAVVALGNRILFFTVLYWIKRTPCRHKGLAIGPGQQISGSRFGSRGWIGQRKNNWPIHVGSHISNHCLCEQTGNPCDTDQARSALRCERHQQVRNRLGSSAIPSR